MRRISFYWLGGLIVCFGLSYGWPELYDYGIFGLFMLLVALGYNVYRISTANYKIELVIKTPPIFTLGDPNTITITLKNTGLEGVNLEPIIFEAYNRERVIFQHELFHHHLFLKSGETIDFSFLFQPKTRGLLMINPLEVTYFIPPYLLRKSLKLGTSQTIKVYPSILQMKHFKMLFTANLKQIGRSMALKKVHDGFSYELEQILPYNTGDDTRKINWRVSGRKAELMVNKYQSDRRRDVYIILDSTRPMLQEGVGSMSIFEYAINMTLMLANIILQKGDRCGLIVVGKQTEIRVALGGGQKQLKRILESLYQLVPTDNEGDFFKIERLVGRKDILLVCSHEEQLTGIYLPVFKRLFKLFSTIPVWLSERSPQNFKALGLQAGRDYLSKRTR